MFFSATFYFFPLHGGMLSKQRWIINNLPPGSRPGCAWSTSSAYLVLWMEPATSACSRSSTVHTLSGRRSHAQLPEGRREQKHEKSRQGRGQEINNGELHLGWNTQQTIHMESGYHGQTLNRNMHGVPSDGSSTKILNS